MAKFLLVHGSCHGAWCWKDTIPALEALGHDVKAIDLPSHGQDRTPLADVTLESYADAIVDALEAPSLVVGHSMGGFPITQAAANRPDLVQGLIFLCAYLPIEGHSLSDMRQHANDHPLLPAIRRSDDGLSMTFDPNQIERLFYHDCPPGTYEFASAHLSPQALKPQRTTIEGLEKTKDIPKAYIVCEEDRAIPPAFQYQMAAVLPDAQCFSLPTSHSPFFSAPKALAQQLSDIARVELMSV